MTRELLDRCAALALENVRREYPNHVLLLVRDDADLRPPRELTPAFYGSFDWHSSVHGHWSLVRLLREVPGAPWSDAARAVLGEHLAAARIAGECAFAAPPERAGWERPYGLAWLLQLAAELAAWRDDPDAAAWSAALAPLEALAVERLVSWLPRLRHPIRGGEHSQLAFALGLVRDWARSRGRDDVRALVDARAREFYGGDRDAPIDYEPSGHDFLSPVLGEADLMRRVLPPAGFTEWFDGFVPWQDAGRARRWLTPVASSDRADGKLAHLDGLNLSRAWMLEGVAASLPPAHGARGLLEHAARSHASAGLAALAGGEYAGTHWLGSFAVYLLTRRGLAA